MHWRVSVPSRRRCCCQWRCALARHQRGRSCGPIPFLARKCVRVWCRVCVCARACRALAQSAVVASSSYPLAASLAAQHDAHRVAAVTPEGMAHVWGRGGYGATRVRARREARRLAWRALTAPQRRRRLGGAKSPCACDVGACSGSSQLAPLPPVLHSSAQRSADVVPGACQALGPRVAQPRERAGGHGTACCCVVRPLGGGAACCVAP